MGHLREALKRRKAGCNNPALFCHCYVYTNFTP
nr:MAG TPA: protein of unknown function (DUF3336) [Caudoviricetes sp.]